MIQDADRKAAKGGSKRRRATKRELATRDLKFIEKLAAGVTIEELAASEGISPQWVRRRKAAILARRAIDPPHEFIQLQIRRLSEAMLVAYTAMNNGNFRRSTGWSKLCASSIVITVSALTRTSRGSPRRAGRAAPCLARAAGGPSCAGIRAGDDGSSKLRLAAIPRRVRLKRSRGAKLNEVLSL